MRQRPVAPCDAKTAPSGRPVAAQLLDTLAQLLDTLAPRRAVSVRIAELVAERLLVHSGSNRSGHRAADLALWHSSVVQMSACAATSDNYVS